MGYGMPGSGSMIFNTHPSTPGGHGHVHGHPGMSTHNSQNFSPLPPPQAPFAQYSSHSHSRRGSSSSPRNSRHSSETMPPPSIPTSRSGTHSGSRSPSDNSPRRHSGALPPNVRRTSGSFVSATALAGAGASGSGIGSGSATRARPASVPHRDSFDEEAIHEQREAGAMVKSGERGMPLRSAMRGSSSNVNVNAGVNGAHVQGQGQGQGYTRPSGSNSATASRTVSWSGPPPVDSAIDIPETEGGAHPSNSERREGTGSLPDGYETPERIGQPGQSGHAGQAGQVGRDGHLAIQTSGYTNGLGNTYTRSPVMLSTTRSRSSDYFGRNSQLSNNNINSSGSAVNLDSPSAAGAELPLPSPRPQQRTVGTHARSSSQGQGQMAGTNQDQAEAAGSTAPSVAASGSTGPRSSQAFANNNGMAQPQGYGSTGSATASGSGSGSVPSVPSVPSLPSAGSSNAPALPYVSGNTINPNGRALSRSNLSAMLNGSSRIEDDYKESAMEQKHVEATGRNPGAKHPKGGVKVAKGGKEGKEQEAKVGKIKSEKSMKNVAGALARFWVG